MAKMQPISVQSIDKSHEAENIGEYLSVALFAESQLDEVKTDTEDRNA